MTTNVLVTYENLDKLVIENVTVALVKYNDNPNSKYTLQFPISFTADRGGNNIQQATSSEAFWYYIQLAYDAASRDQFSNESLNTMNLQQLLNGYCYCVMRKQSIIDSNDGKSYLYSAGLMGWQPIIGIPFAQNVLLGTIYDITETPSMGTATDADMHILLLMYYTGKNSTIKELYYPSTDSTYPSYSNGIINSMSITFQTLPSNFNVPAQATQQGASPPQTTPIPQNPSLSGNVLLQAFCSFFTSPISNIIYPYGQANTGFYFTNVETTNPTIATAVVCDFRYNPMLCNDQYGGGSICSYNNLGGATALNPSYFDPVCLYNLFNVAKEMGFSSSYAYSYSYSGSNIPIGTQVPILPNYKDAITNSIIYLKCLQSYYKDPIDNYVNSYGLPDNPYWTERDVSQIYYRPAFNTQDKFDVARQDNTADPNSNEQAHYVGYDSIRVLQNLGMFAYLCYNGTIKVDDFYTQNQIDDIIIIGIRMMNYVINNSNNKYQPDMYLLFNDPAYPGDLDNSLKGGALIAPLCVGMTGLIHYVQRDNNQSPFYSEITQANV
jgi:hypothetical protein